MKIEQFLPSAILKPFIRTFMIIESEDALENRTLPDTGIVLSFRCQGSVSFKGEDSDKAEKTGKVSDAEQYLPLSNISGLRQSSRLISYGRHTINLLVILTEGGAAAFFKEPMHELFETSLSLDHFFPRSKLNDIEEALAETTRNPDRIAIIEKFLFNSLTSKEPDLLILDAIRTIKKANGSLRIKDLIASLPISQDPFEKRFRRLTGASPKQFAGITRLRGLISNYSPAQSLTDLAYSTGYFDQAHFIKDFRSFTGQSPRDFFKTLAFW
jgi:methylphosphotriester-DNA--protein-cysteine methyltransferase